MAFLYDINHTFECSAVTDYNFWESIRPNLSFHTTKGLSKHHDSLQKEEWNYNDDYLL